MNAGAILGALKAVGNWVMKNPNIAFDAVDRVVKIQDGKKIISTEEHLQSVEEKVNQLGAAALELDQKIDNETASLRNELSIAYKQLRTIKIILSAVVAVLGITVVSLVLLAVL